MSTHLFVGLDMSLSKTGVVVLDEQFRMVHHDLWKPKDLRGAERLQWFRVKFRQLIELVGALDGLGAVQFAAEDYAYSDGDPRLGELGGVIKITLSDHKREFQLFTPSAIKKFASGKGNSPKDVMVATVLGKWKQDFTSYGQGAQDVADAYCVARFAAAYWVWHAVQAGTCKSDWTPLAYELEALEGKKTPKVKKKRVHNPDAVIKERV